MDSIFLGCVVQWEAELKLKALILRMNMDVSEMDDEEAEEMTNNEDAGQKTAHIKTWQRMDSV